jgi:hypothetical protein
MVPHISSAAQSNAAPQRFTAGAINLDSGATGLVQIVVERWSPAADRDRLLTVALNQGPEKLLEVLRSLPRMGFFRTPDQLGWDIHYAARTPLEDGGERVVLATDRRIGFWETAAQQRSIDYPFTLIELHLGPDGKGEGKMSIATKIIVDKKNKTLFLEDYGMQPVLLTDVRRER